MRALPETIYRMKAMYQLRASKPNVVPICLWNGAMAPRISENASKTCYYWRMLVLYLLLGRIEE